MRAMRVSFLSTEEAGSDEIVCCNCSYNTAARAVWRCCQYFQPKIATATISAAARAQSARLPQRARQTARRSGRYCVYGFIILLFQIDRGSNTQPHAPLRRVPLQRIGSAPQRFNRHRTAVDLIFANDHGVLRAARIGMLHLRLEAHRSAIAAAMLNDA